MISVITISMYYQSGKPSDLDLHCFETGYTILRHVYHMTYVVSGIEITPCNKICKPLVVYRFSGNVMTSIARLRT